MTQDRRRLDLKPLSQDAIPRALERAERYRLLNEPREAESICRDVLRTDPTNQKALVTQLLALTDQFREGSSVGIGRPQEILPRLEDEYERSYYAGVICERWGKFQLRQGKPARLAHDWLRMAMEWFEKAESIRPPHNEDAILRWNACARIIAREGAPDSGGPTGEPHAGIDEEVPPR